MNYDEQVALEEKKEKIALNLENIRMKDLRVMESWKFRCLQLFESWKSAIEFAKISIQSLITISGGATIALAAFLGSVLSKNCSIADASFLMNFINASILACVCAGISYLAQISFTHEEEDKIFTIKFIYIGRILQLLAISSYLLALYSLYNGGVVLVNNLKSKQIIDCKNISEGQNSNSIPFLVFPSQ